MFYLVEVRSDFEPDPDENTVCYYVIGICNEQMAHEFCEEDFREDEKIPNSDKVYVRTISMSTDVDAVMAHRQTILSRINRQYN